MLRLLKIVIYCLCLVGCSNNAVPDYKKSTTVPSLEIPPDLLGSIDESSKKDQ